MPIDWRRTASIRPIRLGFLGDWPFRYGNPLFGVLDCLGFPWILSSDRDLSMGYAAQSGETFSRASSLALSGTGTEACGRGHAEAQDYSRGKLNQISDFLQQIVPCAFRPPQYKSSSP
jgi:hypothetical protein